jgi:hypothetical protein
LICTGFRHSAPFPAEVDEFIFQIDTFIFCPHQIMRAAHCAAIPTDQAPRNASLLLQENGDLAAAMNRQLR